MNELEQKIADKLLTEAFVSANIIEMADILREYETLCRGAKLRNEVEFWKKQK